MICFRSRFAESAYVSSTHSNASTSKSDVFLRFAVFNFKKHPNLVLIDMCLLSPSHLKNRNMHAPMQQQLPKCGSSGCQEHNNRFLWMSSRTQKPPENTLWIPLEGAGSAFPQRFSPPAFATQELRRRPFLLSFGTFGWFWSFKFIAPGRFLKP